MPVELDLDRGANCFAPIYFAEVWDADHRLVENQRDGLGDDVAQIVRLADLFRPGVEEARRQRVGWRDVVVQLLSQVELLALLTLPRFPPRLDEIGADATELVIGLTRHTSPFNAAGVPCTTQPVPVAGSALPASLQLVGPRRGGAAAGRRRAGPGRHPLAGGGAPGAGLGQPEGSRHAKRSIFGLNRV